MYAGPIVDSHFHVFRRADIPQYRILSAAVVQRDFALTDHRAAMQPANVVGGVIMQAADVGTGMDELAYVERLPEDWLVRRFVSYLPIDRPDGPRIVAQLAQHPLVAGVRYSPSQARDGQSEGIELAPALATLEALGRHRLVYELSVRPWQHSIAYDLARRAPGTTFVLGHLGKPRLTHERQDDWRSGMERLACLSNVVCKISAPLEGPDDPPYDDAIMRPIVQHAVTCFGYDRVLFGSNFPVCFISVSCRAWLDMLESFLPDASAEELDRLYRANAARVYGLPI